MSNKILMGLVLTASGLVMGTPARAGERGIINATPKIFAAQYRTGGGTGKSRAETVTEFKVDPVSEGSHDATSTVILTQATPGRANTLNITSNGINASILAKAYTAKRVDASCVIGKFDDEFADEDDSHDVDPTTDSRIDVTSESWDTSNTWWGVVDSTNYSPVGGHVTMLRDALTNKGNACKALFNVCMKFASADRKFGPSEGGLDAKHCLDIGNKIATANKCGTIRDGRPTIVDMCDEAAATWCDLDGSTVDCASTSCTSAVTSGSICTKHMTCTAYCAASSDTYFVTSTLKNKHCAAFTGGNCVERCRNAGGAGENCGPLDGITTGFQCL